MLCISTSEQVLRMPFAGRNKFFDAKTTFCVLLSQKFLFELILAFYFLVFAWFFGKLTIVSPLSHAKMVILLTTLLRLSHKSESPLPTSCVTSFMNGPSWRMNLFTIIFLYRNRITQTERLNWPNERKLKIIFDMVKNLTTLIRWGSDFSFQFCK